MERALRDFVWQRAEGCCEYCQLPEASSVLPFHIDHIQARKHRGQTVAENLALACYDCNSYKGPNIAGIDVPGDVITRLFHPRQDEWATHFIWQGGLIVPRTGIGRVTLYVLVLNDPDRVVLRLALIQSGAFTPSTDAS